MDDNTQEPLLQLLLLVRETLEQHRVNVAVQPEKSRSSRSEEDEARIRFLQQSHTVRRLRGIFGSSLSAVPLTAAAAVSCSRSTTTALPPPSDGLSGSNVELWLDHFVAPFDSEEGHTAAEGTTTAAAGFRSAEKVEDEKRRNLIRNKKRMREENNGDVEDAVIDRLRRQREARTDALNYLCEALTARRR